MARNDLCSNCGQTDDFHDSICIIEVGMKHEYRLPSFPTFQVMLRQIKFRLLDQEGTVAYTGFARDSQDFEGPVPFSVKVCPGCENSFLIEVSEFVKSSIELQGPLLEGKVYILWKWDPEWHDDYDIDKPNRNKRGLYISNDDDDEDGGDGAGSDDDDEGEHESSASNTGSIGTHSVTFKCMGTTKISRSQVILASASNKLDKGEPVEVRLRKEPDNPKDSRAIAFDCKMDQETKWEKIGYVVQEALDGVHDAIQGSTIVSVKLEWARFITHWSRCSPGWYCGITITKRGQWPREVVRHRSTL